jgi:16S rRNA (cytosine967-C5)-methyltransferase
MKKRKATDVRELAAKALVGIESGRLTPKKALEQKKTAPALARRDRAFLMELVYGTLRQRGFLDWVLAGFLKKKPGNLYTLNNLRTALYQLLFTRVAERAAVFEAVEAEDTITSTAPA